MENNEKKVKEMRLSEQALQSLMMALQNSLMEQSDIVPVLQGFRFVLSDQGLMIMNPPLVKVEVTDEDFVTEG